MLMIWFFDLFLFLIQMLNTWLLVSHHFIRELVENKIVVVEHVTTEQQLVDIFTKALDASKFVSLKKILGICTM